MIDSCQWIEDDATGHWDTDCGNIFEIIEGTPKHNEMKYCPYCGKRLAEVKNNYKYEEEI